MINTKSIEKEVDNIEDNLKQEFKQKLENLSEDEFKEYYIGLIKKYYAVLFNFDNDYNSYIENSNNKYETINIVRKLASSKYKKLSNFEIIERLKQAEDIAYKEMNDLYFMESNYKDFIYYNSTNEVIFLKRTLSNLIDVYEEEPSEKLLSAIENTLINAVPLMKEVNKLPLSEASLEFNPTYEEGYIEEFDNIYQYHLEEVLEDFNKTYEKLITILPEDVIVKYEFELYKPDLDLYDIIKEDLKDNYSEEEIAEFIVYINYLNEKNYKGYLYEIL